MDDGMKGGAGRSGIESSVAAATSSGAAAAAAQQHDDPNNRTDSNRGAAAAIHQYSDDDNDSGIGSTGRGGGGISMTQDMIAWDSDDDYDEGDDDADHRAAAAELGGRDRGGANAADTAAVAASGGAGAAGGAGTGGEVDLRSLIFRSPVPPPSSAKRRSSHSGRKRSGGGCASRSGGSTTSSGSAGRLKSRRKKSGSGRRSRSSMTGREVRLFHALLDGEDAASPTTSASASVVATSSAVADADANASAAATGDTADGGDAKPSPADGIASNANDAFNDESLIQTQERSNVTEGAAAAAAAARATSASASGGMESQDDENDGSLSIAPGSRRRLRRINTNDGVVTDSTSAAAVGGDASSAASVTTPNIPVYTESENVDGKMPQSTMPPSSTTASAAAAAAPPTMAPFLHPTAMQDIEDMAAADAGPEDQMRKRRRPAAIGGAASTLYGKENNRVEDRGAARRSNQNMTKKIKTHQQQPFGDSAEAASAAATTTSTAPPPASNASAATASLAPAADRMEGVARVGSSTKNGSSDEPDPFENLLEQIDHDGLGVKSPVPIVKRQQQQQQQQREGTKTALSTTTAPASTNTNSGSLSLSQPNPYTKALSVSIEPRRSGSLPARPTTAPHVPTASTSSINSVRPSSAPNRTTSNKERTHQEHPQKLHTIEPQAAAAPVQAAAPAIGTSSKPIVETKQQPQKTTTATAGVELPTAPATSAPATSPHPDSAPPNPSASDDLLGGIDFNDDFFSAMDNLVTAKQDQKLKAEVAGSASMSARAPAAPALAPQTAAPNNAVDEEFGAFPDLNFAALDDAIGRRSLDAQGTSSSTAISSSVQAQQARGVSTAKVEDDYGDFPDLDFAAMDQLIVHSHPSSAAAALQDPFAIPPSNIPVWNKMTSSPSIPSSSPSFISFTRYKVVSTEEDLATYTRTLRVAKWLDSKDMCDDDEMGGGGRNNQRAPTKADAAPNTFDGCIHLRGEWYHTECEPGDTVHLCSLSSRYETGPMSLPVILHSNPPQGSDLNDDLVLIVHPDTLVTPTNISETVSCVRRAVLKMRLGSSGLSSEAAILGTMRHELFEFCMDAQTFSTSFALEKVQQIVRSHSDTLVGCQYYDDARARHEVMQVLPQIRDFATKYCAFGPPPKQTTLPGARKASKLPGNGFQTDIDFTADAVYATEEAAISPELGLKGFVDATLGTTTRPAGTTSPTLQSLMGLELKTGHRQNPQNEHMAQLALYTLMLRMRRGSAVVDSTSYGHQQGTGAAPAAEADKRHQSLQNGAASGGMLLYLNHEAFLALHVSPVLSELKSLIGQRNVLAIGSRKAMQARGVVVSSDDARQNSGEKPGGRPSSSRGKATNIEILPAPPAQLPEMIPSSNCSRCYSNRECMMYAASDAANVPAFQQSHGSLMNHYTAHLTPEDMQYFLDWDRMVDLESRAGRHDIAKAWLKSSRERECGTGKTFSDLVFAASYQLGQVPQQTQMQSQVCSSNADDDKMILQFDRAPGSVLSSTLLNSLKIEDRSHVVLSTDGTSLQPLEVPRRGVGGGNTKSFRHQCNVFRGIVQKVTDQSVTILASKNDLRQVQDLLTLWQEYNDNARNALPLRFRLDKDDVATGTGTLRQNLIKLFTADVPTFKFHRKQQNVNGNGKNGNSDIDSLLQIRMPWLRRAIIQMEKPQFDPSRTRSMFDPQSFSGAPKVKGCEFEQLAAQYLTLNVDQRHAVDKVISMNDYACIQGLPGTGKTSTIAFIARLLAAQGQRVLITSYTHAAVDNLLMKFIESGVHGSHRHPNCSDLVRIGNKSSCHPDVHPILAAQVALDRENLVGGKPSAGALYQVMSEARIVGCTALTVPRTPLLAKQHFDVAIIDEAGQISQPAILGALASADSFVLVGDHMQLPPLVANDAAEQAGYGISMLKRLAERQPDSIAKLTLQYRMHENICNLCNEIIYRGELKCANETVRSSKLILSRYPKALPIPTQHDSNGNEPTSSDVGWLQRVLNPDMPAVFVDTDALGCSASGTFQGLERSSGRRQGGTIVNDTEVSLVRSIVRSLLKCGLNSASIGVICPYRSQLRLLDDDNFLRRMKKAGLEISTIDRYQGRDKAAIVISLVRSNTEGKSGRLLEDFRRLNVAISRAKRKLIIVGSMKTLTKGSDVLRPLLQSMSRQGWVESLPRNAIEMYEPTLLSSQTTAATTQSSNLS